MTLGPSITASKERIALFVKALRSGDYAQGKGRLRRGNKYCCLGVACDIYQRQTGLGEWEAENSDYHDTHCFIPAEGLSQAALLPDVVYQWFGFLSAIPMLKAKPDEGMLADMFDATELNDYWNWSFDQIAQAFEDTFLKEK